MLIVLVVLAEPVVLCLYVLALIFAILAALFAACCCRNLRCTVVGFVKLSAVAAEVVVAEPGAAV